MASEIVDFPINSMVIFHSYVNVYQRVISKTKDLPILPRPFLNRETIDVSQFTALSSKFHGTLPEAS